MKKTRVKILIACVVFVAACMLAFWAGALHSKNSVEAYKDQLRAVGEKLELAEVVPSRPDAASNSVELFQRVKHLMGPELPGALNTNPPPVMRQILPGKAIVASQQTNVIGGGYYSQQFFTNSWPEFEADLDVCAGALNLLSEVPKRPVLQFPVDYSQEFRIDSTDILAVKRAALLLSAAAICDLHDGNVEGATTNIHVMLSMVRNWDERYLVSQLVRIAIAQIAVAAQWELLQNTNLTDGQLALLQRDWENPAFVRPMEHALEMERVCSILMIQGLRGSNDVSAAVSTALGYGISPPGGGSSGTWVEDLKDFGQSVREKTAATLWRGSWSYEDELDVLRADQVLIESVRSFETNGCFNEAIAEKQRKLKASGLDRPKSNWVRDHLYAELAVIGIGAIDYADRSINRLLTAEAVRRLSVVAISLKRYQLRHGSLPTALDALVPAFLSEVPRDPVDGKPLRYKLEPDGTFKLYSIGEDGSDDGGDPTDSRGKGNHWLGGKDWVWPQPATPEEVQDYYDNLPN